MQEPNAQVHECLARREVDEAPISESVRALLRFVALVTQAAYRTTDADVQRLRDVGWTDPQIAECVYITALFAFFNRVADAFGLADPNYFAQPPARGGDPISPPPPAGPST